MAGTPHPLPGTQKASSSPRAGRDDLKRILHDLDDAAVLEILALMPTVAEVEEAAMRVAGLGDGLNRAGHAFDGKVARIVAIIERDDDTDR